MDIVLIGGTRFIGRRIAEELSGRGHRLMYVHRGETEPARLPPGAHVHVDRLRIATVRGDIEAFRPDAVIDCYAGVGTAARSTVDMLPAGARLVVLSSMDVYRAYASFHAGIVTDAVPLDEDSPVRTGPPPDREMRPELVDYEKLDVEKVYLDAGGTVLRLPIVYGERDYQRREEFVLRRVRAGRARMPFGAGGVLFTRGYVGDVARATALVVERDDVGGEVFNTGERRTMTMWQWAERIAVAAGADLEFVRVPDTVLPPDLAYTAHIAQHVLVSSATARTVLGWEDSDADEALRRSVEWHLAHPPEADDDFSADDVALASV